MLLISHVFRYKSIYLLALSLCIISVLVTPSAASHTSDYESGNGRNPLWNATDTDLLKRDLLAHYDKFARPAQLHNVTTVDLDMVFRHIDLDDTKSLMTVNGWVRMMWDDDKLRWNTSEYGGLNKLHVADHEVWEPDIVLYNSATGNNIDHYGNTHVLVFPNGRVLWVPPSQFAVFCTMDITRWPFDRHTCTLRLGSWTYGGDMVDLITNVTAPVEIDLDASNWKVVSITKTRNIRFYKCCEEPYTDIQFNITVERDSTAYHTMVFVPAIGVMILCLSVFWIPANSGSKFVVAATTALIQAMFLVYFSQRLVTLGPHTPLIVLYYAYSLILVGISMIVSIISYNMATKPNSRPVPHVLMNIINSKVSGFLMLPKYQWSSTERAGEELTERSTLDEDREDLTATATHAKRPTTAEWFVLASALDRVVFFIYIIVFVGFAIRCVL